MVQTDEQYPPRSSVQSREVSFQDGVDVSRTEVSRTEVSRMSVAELKSDDALTAYIENRTGGPMEDVSLHKFTQDPPQQWSGIGTDVILPPDLTRDSIVSRAGGINNSVYDATNNNSVYSGANSSVQSSTSARKSCGTAVPLQCLERHEAIACHASGKRNPCAKDDLIRIYVKFPLSGDRIAFWVQRELMIGGVLPGDEERKKSANDGGDSTNSIFYDIKVNNTGVRNSYFNRSSVGTTDSILPGAVGSRVGSVSNNSVYGGSNTTTSVYGTGGTPGTPDQSSEYGVRDSNNYKFYDEFQSGSIAYQTSLMRQDNLKFRISKLTGIPISHMKLWHKKIVLANPLATLRRAGIGHGSEILIRCKTRVPRDSAPNMSISKSFLESNLVVGDQGLQRQSNLAMAEAASIISQSEAARNSETARNSSEMAARNSSEMAGRNSELPRPSALTRQSDSFGRQSESKYSDQANGIVECKWGGGSNPVPVRGYRWYTSPSQQNSEALISHPQESENNFNPGGEHQGGLLPLPRRASSMAQSAASSKRNTAETNQITKEYDIDLLRLDKKVRALPNSEVVTLFNNNNMKRENDSQMSLMSNGQPRYSESTAGPARDTNTSYARDSSTNMQAKISELDKIRRMSSGTNIPGRESGQMGRESGQPMGQMGRESIHQARDSDKSIDALIDELARERISMQEMNQMGEMPPGRMTDNDYLHSITEEQNASSENLNLNPFEMASATSLGPGQGNQYGSTNYPNNSIKYPNGSYPTHLDTDSQECTGYSMESPHILDSQEATFLDYPSQYAPSVEGDDKQGYERTQIEESIDAAEGGASGINASGVGNNPPSRSILSRVTDWITSPSKNKMKQPERGSLLELPRKSGSANDASSNGGNHNGVHPGRTMHPVGQNQTGFSPVVFSSSNLPSSNDSNGQFYTPNDEVYHSANDEFVPLIDVNTKINSQLQRDAQMEQQGQMHMQGGPQGGMHQPQSDDDQQKQQLRAHLQQHIQGQINAEINTHLQGVGQQPRRHSTGGIVAPSQKDFTNSSSVGGKRRHTNSKEDALAILLRQSNNTSASGKMDGSHVQRGSQIPPEGAVLPRFSNKLRSVMGGGHSAKNKSNNGVGVQKPFIIMPKMQFSDAPKLFHNITKNYENPMYFARRFDKDSGHGDAFQRVREKVLGL